jgi:hypothetical protein
MSKHFFTFKMTRKWWETGYVLNVPFFFFSFFSFFFIKWVYFQIKGPF